jgi:hypothetical protein
MEDRQVTPRAFGIGERPDVVAQVVVHGEREDVGPMAHAPQEIADLPGAVPDRISLVRGGHPLVDHHRGRQRGASGSAK